MKNNPSPLLLHSYSGRENGLMVVGDRNALRALGQQLVAAADAEDSSPPTQGWPVEVSHPVVVGPYKDVPEFSLSFHLQDSSQTSKVLPLRRCNLPAPIFLAVTACTVVGLVTIFRWAVGYALS